MSLQSLLLLLLITIFSTLSYSEEYCSIIEKGKSEFSFLLTSNSKKVLEGPSSSHQCRQYAKDLLGKKAIFDDDSNYKIYAVSYQYRDEDGLVEEDEVFYTSPNPRLPIIGPEK